MLRMFEVFRAQEAFGGGHVAIGEHPPTREIRVVGLVDVFEEHFLMVTAECDYAIAVTVLQVHDVPEDVQAIGAAIAVITQQYEPRRRVVQVDCRHGVCEGFMVAVDIGHGVNAQCFSFCRHASAGLECRSGCGIGSSVPHPDRSDSLAGLGELLDKV